MRETLWGATKKPPEGGYRSPNWTRTNNPSISGSEQVINWTYPQNEKKSAHGVPQPVYMACDNLSTGDELEAVQAWLEHLRAEGMAGGTVRLKAHYLTDLARVAAPLTATTEDIVRWMNAHDWKPETRKSARSAVRGFYAWALAAGLVEVDPTATLRPVHIPVSKPRPTPEMALEAALDAATDEERVMLLLMAYAGLRRAEVASLRWSDVSESQLRVHGKGGRVRLVPVHPRLAHALQAWRQRTGGGRPLAPKARPVSTGCFRAQ